jgi:hypothetical protein
MQISDFLHVLEILAWPVVAIAAILVVRPHLSSIFSGVLCPHIYSTDLNGLICKIERVVC